MELDDLKNTWNNINSQAEKQQSVSPEMIEQIITKKYKSRLKKITYPEVVGIIFCLMGAAYIMVNYSQLDTGFLKGTGILSVLLLVVLPVISLLSLRHISIGKNINKPYAETLKRFASQKIQFFKMQRLNINLSYLLLVTVVILMAKFFGRKDITTNGIFWTFSFTLGYIFLLYYEKWVSKHYRKTLQQAEEVLKEISINPE